MLPNNSISLTSTSSVQSSYGTQWLYQTATDPEPRTVFGPQAITSSDMLPSTELAAVCATTSPSYQRALLRETEPFAGVQQSARSYQMCPITAGYPSSSHDMALLQPALAFPERRLPLPSATTIRPTSSSLYAHQVDSSMVCMQGHRQWRSGLNSTSSGRQIPICNLAQISSAMPTVGWSTAPSLAHTSPSESSTAVSPMSDFDASIASFYANGGTLSSRGTSSYTSLSRFGL